MGTILIQKSLEWQYWGDCHHLKLTKTTISIVNLYHVHQHWYGCYP